MSKKPQHAKHTVEKKPAGKMNFLKSKKADNDKNSSQNDAEMPKEVKPEKKNKACTGVQLSELGHLNNILLIRLVAASLIFAVSLILKMPALARTLLLAVSALAAGYDIFMDAVNKVEQGDYFATPLVVVFVTVLSFVIGFGSEGAALVLLYQIGILLIGYTVEKTRKSAYELLRYQDPDTISKFEEILKQDGAGHMEIEDTMRYSSGSILKLAMIIAVIYAITLPLFTSFGFTVSIHRALMMILICTPVSVVAAMPVTGIVGLCYSAQQGVLFKNAAALEKAGKCSIAVLDKAGVFTDETPRILSVESDVIDQQTFMNFASHALYYSEQPIAKAISQLNNQEYRLELISDFVDIPGFGVDVKIGGAKVTLASSEYFAGRGVYIPQDENQQGQVFYMTVSDRYVGKISIVSDVKTDAADLAENMTELGFRRIVLLTEEGEEESQELADELSIDELISGCNTEKKLSLIHDLKEDSSNRVMYVYSRGFEAHSDADIDMRVGLKAKFADARVVPKCAANIPFSVEVSRRTREVATTNAVFAFLVKVLLIFLSIIGYCNIWFAVFIDMAAALATVLNAIRVTSEPIIKRR